MDRPTNDSLQPFIQAKAIRMAFGGAEVLKGVDLDLYPGEVHAILGENGAGKSTMAKIMAGVHKPTGGTLSIGGVPTRLDGPRHALQLGIALIHQEPLTFPDLDVAENIFVGHQPVRGVRGVDWTAMREKAGEMLATLGAALKPTDRVGGLSVADQQMVELAAALSHDAKALILDETTASLTPKEVAELFDIVRRLREQGRAIAFVSHRLDEVFAIADRITVLRDGEKVGEKKPSETSIEEIVRMMVGRDVTSTVSAPVSASVAQSSPILKVRGLSVSGRFEDVSFELRPGEIVGLGGLVGAGRTDVCNAIFGLTRLSGGSVEVDGKAVRIGNPQQAMKLGLALVPEDRQHEGLILSMSLAENASLAILRSLAKVGWLNRTKENVAAETELKKLQTVFRSVGQAAKELSGGNQQKIVLAKWLLSKPRLLLLDEPTRGVDIGAKSEVHRLIRELAEDGMAILMVSSDLPELLELSQRVLVMREGRLVAEFPGQEANPEKVMLAASGQVAVAV